MRLSQLMASTLAAGTMVCGMMPSAMAGDFNVDYRFRVGQFYDDNVAYSTEGNEQTDYITRITPGIGLRYDTVDTQVRFTTDITQEYFWVNTDNHNTSVFADLNVQHQFTKYDAVVVKNRFSRTLDPASFDEQFARVGGRFRRYQNEFDLKYLREINDKLAVSLGGGYDVNLVSRNDLIDSTVLRVSAEGSYELTSKNTLFSRYDYSRRDYEPGGTASVHTISGGARQMVTDTLSIQGFAGFDIVTAIDDDTKVRPSWSIGLTDDLNETTTFDLNVGQRYSTNPYTSDVFDSWTVDATLSRQLTAKLRGSASAYYGSGEYDEIALEENFFGGNLELAYDIRDNVQGKVAYTHTTTESNFDTREYEKNVVYLGVSSQF